MADRLSMWMDEQTQGKKELLSRGMIVARVPKLESFFIEGFL